MFLGTQVSSSRSSRQRLEVGSVRVSRIEVAIQRVKQHSHVSELKNYSHDVRVN